jgi:predicted outer membrane repeat protein
MTIRHGRPRPKEEDGGGVKNYGTLTIRNCVVTKNSAVGGGGISNDGALTVVASTIRDNVARGDGPPGQWCGGGGGIKSSSGTLMVVNSTVTANQGGLRARGLGGGIRTGCGCTAEIINTTVSRNTAAKEGGGVAASGTVRIANCTIANNTLKGGKGGGLWIRGEVSLENTIIAGNTGGGEECTIGGEGGHVGTGTAAANINNLVGDGSCGAEFSGDPMLGPLADNGGPTLTHALLPDSPAIDAVSAISCTVSTDQREVIRPIALTSSDTPCDIGAFEVQRD